MSLREALRTFVRTRLIEEDEAMEFEDDDSLIHSGVVDSIAMLQLMHFIEEETGLRIPDDEVQLENFQSISSIERTVERLLEKGKSYRL